MKLYKVTLIYLVLSGCASNYTVSGLTRSSIALGDVVSEMKREEIAFRIVTSNKIRELEERICELESSRPFPNDSEELSKKFRKYMSK